MPSWHLLGIGAQQQRGCSLPGTALSSWSRSKAAGGGAGAHMMSGPSRMKSQSREKNQRTMTQNAPVKTAGGWGARGAVSRCLVA